ncbi:MAG TPA: glycosyl hydrolase family 18 protein, partial [Ktedonobacterales bacterium]
SGRGSRMTQLAQADMPCSRGRAIPWPPAPPARHPLPWRRLIRRALLCLLVGALLLSVGAGYVYHRLTATLTSYPSAHFNTGRNAIWLEHTWAGDAHTAADYDALAAQLQREQITYVFAHVGPMSSDGTIPASLASWAPQLAAALHARMPGVKVLAWIGQLEAASGAPADEVVNLASASTRLTIAATAARFVNGDDFDGVHYDIEPITNNNSHFLDLLIETRAALPPGAILSVSAQKWSPNAHIADLLYQAGHAGQWTSYYMAAVAAHVDQMAVMTYDSGMPTAAAYQIFLQQETKHILAAIDTAQHPPQLLIGVPTYSGNSLYFHDSAENMTSALAGVTAGLNSSSDTQPFVGVAIYRLAVTSDADWQVYDRVWLGQG